MQKSNFFVLVLISQRYQCNIEFIWHTSCCREKGGFRMARYWPFFILIYLPQPCYYCLNTQIKNTHACSLTHRCLGLGNFVSLVLVVIREIIETVWLSFNHELSTIPNYPVSNVLKSSFVLNSQEKLVSLCLERVW